MILAIQVSFENSIAYMQCKCCFAKVWVELFFQLGKHWVSYHTSVCRKEPCNHWKTLSMICECCVSVPSYTKLLKVSNPSSINQSFISLLHSKRKSFNLWQQNNKVATSSFVSIIWCCKQVANSEELRIINNILVPTAYHRLIQLL